MTREVGERKKKEASEQQGYFNDSSIYILVQIFDDAQTIEHLELILERLRLKEKFSLLSTRIYT
jgi:hypothetical protein